jgi:uncharacterized RDD family membrane protein YckC
VDAPPQPGVALEPTQAAGATVTDAGRDAPPDPRGPSALTPGDVVAHFRVEALLGRGGMGEVYRATDLALDRPVALKVLPADVAGDAGRRERMIREARAQARVVHGNVCHIYFIGEERGLLFFAMEYVPGETLAERIARGPMAPEDAIEAIRMAALGLAEAHAHGFTHRDVKPSNLMVDGHGQVKVVDFGLVTRGPGPAGAAADATTAVGTPLYMAPEQARGEAVDLRADIYALGATLHHLVSGRPPFAGDSPEALRSLHETALRPALEARGRRGRVLALVDGVCARMMAKRPEDRFGSYDELIAELERISPRRTPPAGFWVRAFAALVDVMIAGLLTLVVELALPMVRGNVILWTILGTFAVVGTWRWGRTIGRALLEIEVVSVATGRPPPWPRALVRTVVELGPLAVVSMINTEDHAGEGIQVGGGTLGLIAIGLALAILAWSAWRRPDKRTLWDRAAGTMVRYRRAPPR